MLHLVRANVGLMISLGLLAGGAFVCTVLGLIMARSGASLRSIYWFAGFFALIVVPQVLGQFYKAWQTTRAERPRAIAMERLTSGAGAGPGSSTENDPAAAARSDDAKSLFGPDVDPQLVVDVRRAHGEAFSGAEFAQFAVLPTGETVLLARFNGSSAAEKGWVNYLRVSGLRDLPGQGDSQRGYVVTRPTGDRAYALHMGNMMGVWTGKDDAAIRQRMLAGGFEVPGRAPLGTEAAADSGVAVGPAPKAPAQSSSPLRVALIAAAIAVYGFVVVLYYFKGVAWAGTYPARPGTAPVAAGDLMARLESINALGVPFQIERGAHPNELFATWRYGDAKWVDLARARGLRRSFRIRLVLDEKAATVRATDYVASVDWSVGRGGADLEWKAGIGLVLFQREHQRVFGLQLDEHGRFKPALSYAYTFNLQEMKSPLMEAVSHAGWNWRPTVWQGPTWLRWLTE